MYTRGTTEECKIKVKQPSILVLRGAAPSFSNPLPLSYIVFLGNIVQRTHDLLAWLARGYSQSQPITRFVPD